MILLISWLDVSISAVAQAASASTVLLACLGIARARKHAPVRDARVGADQIRGVALAGIAVQWSRMLSQRTRYTIRALLHLADRFGVGPVQLSEIAEAQNIPPKFLTVMLSQMSRAGLVASRRGRDGGYWLARSPGEISYGEIVRITRGSLGLVPCASRLAYSPCDNCITEEKCRLHRVMLLVRDQTAVILDGLTLADVIPQERLADDEAELR